MSWRHLCLDQSEGDSKVSLQKIQLWAKWEQEAKILEQEEMSCTISNLSITVYII